MIPTTVPDAGRAQPRSPRPPVRCALTVRRHVDLARVSSAICSA